MEFSEPSEYRHSSTYRPLLLVSLLSLIVTIPVGGVLTIAAMLKGGGDNYGDHTSALSGTGYVIGLAIMSVIWMAIVLAILTARRDGVSKRAKVSGVVAACISFWTLLLTIIVLFSKVEGHVVLLPLLGAPVLAAFAGSYVVGSGWFE